MKNVGKRLCRGVLASLLALLIITTTMQITSIKAYAEGELISSQNFTLEKTTTGYRVKANAVDTGEYETTWIVWWGTVEEYSSVNLWDALVQAMGEVINNPDRGVGKVTADTVSTATAAGFEYSTATTDALNVTYTGTDELTWVMVFKTYYEDESKPDVIYSLGGTNNIPTIINQPTGNTMGGGDGTPELPTHEHNYATTWSSDSSKHWKECTSKTGTCDAPKDSLSNHSFSWITDVPATATTAGKKHEECSVCKYKRNENTVIPATGGGDSGKIDVPKNKEEGNFGAGGLANTVNEIKNAVLTEKDKKAIGEGKNINVWAEIKKQDTDKVKDAEKQKINAKLPAAFNVGAYLDIKLFKQMTGDDVPTSIEKTNGKVKIKLTVPKELQKGGRTYDIIRLHNGEATVLGVTREGYELTIETDGFSTYALIYSDNPAVSTNANRAVTSPKTGESSSPYAGMVLLIASAFALTILTRKRNA